jgi:transposase InsO family protein
MRQGAHGVAMEGFYRYVGISRQGFSKMAKRHHEREIMVGEIEGLVKTYRRDKDRRAGSRSLFNNLDIKSRYGIGATKFEQLMSGHGLSLSPLRVRVVTTKSSMQSWNYSNLINGLTISDISQVVVGDLTYVQLAGQRYYLFCLTDLYSARIVGYQFGCNMRAEDAKKALDMWIRLRGLKNLNGCIHHTDGGSQYFSGAYLGRLAKINAQASCAENCLMNGHAEQRNGLIKHHLVPTIKLGRGKVDKEIKRIMHVYNHERKQERLGWLSPVAFEGSISGLVNKPEISLHKFTGNENGFYKACENNKKGDQKKGNPN